MGPVGRPAKFSKTTLKAFFGREINITFSTALVDIPAVSMPISHSLETSVALCCVTKLHKLVAFYCPPAQGAPV
jgi:hypothetical protein